MASCALGALSAKRPTCSRYAPPPGPRYRDSPGSGVAILSVRAPIARYGREDFRRRQEGHLIIADDRPLLVMNFGTKRFGRGGVAAIAASRIGLAGTGYSKWNVTKWSPRPADGRRVALSPEVHRDLP